MSIITLQHYKSKRKIDYDYVKNYVENLNGQLLTKKYKNMKTPIMIKCHNFHIFRRTLYSIEKNKWCPYCPKKNESYGEKIIRCYLETNKIKFKPQKSFRDLRGGKGKKLKFDYGFDTNKDKKFCIEFDGKQHFEHIEFFGSKDDYEYRKKCDIKKTEYCKNNNISLLRIDYKKSNDEIEKLLDDFFIKVFNDEFICLFSNNLLYSYL
jgi:hypothetical protein